MAMSDRMPSMDDMTKALVADRKMSEPKTKEGSVKAREVEVAGEFEDMVDQGYKGTFEQFLIDMSLGGEDFDPATAMKVSKLPEGIMQLMNMMKDRKTA